jgi:CP family cyanate transporter-like MFS transporter
VLLLVGLVLVASNLRPALTSVSAVLGTIQQDLGLSGAVSGLLTTIPVLCMSVFALSAAWITERIGAERGVLWSVVLIGVATVGRLAGEDLVVLFTATFLVGIGIAVAQSQLPTIVKGHFPQRVALVTGLYTLGINAGAALAAEATPLLKGLLEGFWPGALASWSLLAVVAVAFWLPFASRTRAREGPDAVSASTSLPWRNRRAWLVSLFFGAQSCIYYSCLMWLAPLYADRGLGEGQAATLLTVFTLVQMPVSFFIPAFADRSEDRRPWLALTLIFNVFGLAAVALIPLAAPWAPWAWAVTLGIGTGGLFPLALTLPADNATDAGEASRLTAMAFFVGYLLSALGPLVIGGLRDATGDYLVPFIALGMLGTVMLAVSFWLRPPSDQTTQEDNTDRIIGG